ncbi:MAG: glycerol-3-phosphate dehydrogenase [Candidatus Firestonebacteria bacterium RIFOXYC2_FULL_39_67]|nr:MAG: glycerol-3-phosphate dehydrogenase [Candidatus Firestonebacteria bacterium RIFOXYD2_FULL_39_29]OGF53932.1 MAG: glycerol-3-phosphate dehydrogenase [Candidatus Firestonebacteria bacterium RIFOXYC2_FULL_39_67]
MAEKVAIIGAGGWGTALALVLNENGQNVTIYEYLKPYAKYLNKKRINTKFLPGIKIPEGIKITASLSDAVKEAKAIVIAIPSKFVRSVLDKLKNEKIRNDVVVLSVVKGIDTKTLERMSEIIKKKLGKKIKLAVLSGPSHAEEVGRKMPTAVIVASKDAKIASYFQTLFSNKYFRVYTSRDVIGVELGGALKNVIALSKGILDGMELGDNTKAALLTRGMAEMKRLALKLGAKSETLNGLAGFGDLIVTCMSPHSRNRSVGERIGRGEKLSKILKSMDMVAEGVTTSAAVFRLAKKEKVDMPIVAETYGVLFNRNNPKTAVNNLMQRKLKKEENF